MGNGHGQDEWTEEDYARHEWEEDRADKCIEGLKRLNEIMKANVEYTSPNEFFEWCTDNGVTDTELDNIKDIPHEGRELNQWIYINIK